MTDPSDSHLSAMHLDTVPDGYPHAAETWERLTDGSRVFIRPVVPQDEARMVHAFEFGDGDTIRRRFLTGTPPSRPNQIRYLVTVDYIWRMALVAMDEAGNSVGIGRYEGRQGEREAEVAIVVHPQWRKRGVASVLLRRLEPPALAAGIDVFYAVYQPDNRPVAALLQDLGYSDASLVDALIHTAKTIR